VPLYNFECNGCGLASRTISGSEAEAKAKIRACTCGGDMVRCPKPFTSQAVETIDNGFMVKKVERLVDATRIYRDRANASNPKPDDK
jgi:hypothetical protein